MQIAHVTLLGLLAGAVPALAAGPEATSVLRVEAPRDAIAVYLDGAYIPSATQEISVAPGEHELAAISAEGIVFRRKLSVAPGDAVSTDLSLSREELLRAGEERVTARVDLGRPIDGAAIAGELLVVRSGGSLSAFDVRSLRPKWGPVSLEVAGDPLVLGQRLFAVQRFSNSSENGSWTELFVSELDLSSGGVLKNIAKVKADAFSVVQNGQTAVFLFRGAGFWHFDPTEARLKTLGREAGLPGDLSTVDWTFLNGHLLVRQSEDKLLAVNVREPTQHKLLTLDHSTSAFGPCGALLALQMGDAVVGLTIPEGRPQWQFPTSQPSAIGLECSGSSLLLWDTAGSLELIDLATGEAETVAALEAVRQGLRALWPLGKGHFVLRRGAEVSLYDSPFANERWLVETAGGEALVAASNQHLVVAGRSGSLVTLAVGQRRRLLGWVEELAPDGRSFVATPLPASDCMEVAFLPASTFLDGAVDAAANPQTVCPEQRGEGEKPRRWSLSAAESFRPAPGDLLVAASRVDLELDPPNTLVWMDGAFEGTPKRIWGLSLGPHELYLQHPDRASKTVPLRVEAAGDHFVKETLSPRFEAALAVRTEPQGATVILNEGKAGRTPQNFYELIAESTASVVLRKFGYSTLKRTQSLKSGGNTIDERLEQAPLLGTLMLGVAEGRAPVLGWSNATIGNGGVSGSPLRDGSDGARFKAAMLLHARFGRVEPFVSATAESKRDQLGEAQFGFRLYGWRPISQWSWSIGLSYLFRQGAASRDPSSDSSSGQRTPKPLSEWEHPIPDVKLSNGVTDFFGLHLRLRPRATVFIEAAGGPLRGARLQGRALRREDSELVEDPDRFYRFKAKNGHFFDLSAEVALGSRSFWGMTTGAAFRVQYRLEEVDFGIVRDRTSTLFLGLGIMAFWPGG
jgi:PEGA domain